MNSLYKKNEIGFAILWIVVYVVGFSIADGLSDTIGLYKSVTAIVGIVLCFILYTWIKRNKLENTYGLCPSVLSNKEALYYIPLVLIASVNIWYGIYMNYGYVETILHILSMFCVGFLEEIIFRGFLFKAISKDDLKMAIIVSSVTFGMGHIINLFNGSGMDLVSNLLQVVYAIAAGFMFTMLFHKSKSLYACIITHCVLNSLSAFSDPSLSLGQDVFIAIVLTLVAVLYAFYLSKLKEKVY